MEPLFWILVVVGILIVAGVIHNIRNPPRDIEWAEIPGELRNAFRDSLGGFEVTSVRQIPAARKYKLLGIYREREARAEIECGPKGELDEIEFEDAAIGSVVGSTECRLEDLPPEAVARVGELMGAERPSFQPSRVTAGAYAGQPAFEIRGRSDNWKWEIEITAAGLLIEMEKSVAKTRAGSRSN